MYLLLMVNIILLYLLVCSVISQRYPDSLGLLEDYLQLEDIPRDEIITLVRDSKLSSEALKDFYIFKEHLISIIEKRGDENSEKIDDTSHMRRDRRERRYELALVGSQEALQIADRLLKDLYQLKFPDEKRPIEMTVRLKKELEDSRVTLLPGTIKEYQYLTSLLKLGLKKAYVSDREYYNRQYNRRALRSGKEVKKLNSEDEYDLEDSEYKSADDIDWSWEPNDNKYEDEEEPDELRRIQIDWDGRYYEIVPVDMKRLERDSREQKLDFHQIIFPDEERPKKWSRSMEDRMAAAISASSDLQMKYEEFQQVLLIKLFVDNTERKVYLSEDEYSERVTQAYEKQAKRREQMPAVIESVDAYRKYMEDL